MKLSEKVAIVTGGAKGIGRAIAEGLADDGAAVVIADLADAERAAEKLAGGNKSAIGLRVDVCSEADTARMVEETLARFGRLDILVNNAGLYSALAPTPFEKIEADEWRRVMDVNTLGVFLCCRAAVGAMREGGGGRIVNIASGTPFKGVPFLLHYTASKGAVVAITRALAKELGGSNILVNAVAPGFTLSDGVLNNPAQMEQLREVSANARVIQRDQHPGDIVGAVRFFAGPESAFITGQTLVVDGGAYFH